MRVKKGQVWVETVIYTLIAFTLIGAVLTFVKPKIEEIQDTTLVDQSIEMLKDINVVINAAKGTAGNQRIVDITLKKGSLLIDGVNNKIIFEVESRAEYSQPGTEITRDNLIILTENKGKLNKITLTSDYSSGYNIFYQNADNSKLLSKSTLPYKIEITNKGFQEDNKVMIDMNIK